MLRKLSRHAPLWQSARGCYPWVAFSIGTFMPDAGVAPAQPAARKLRLDRGGGTGPGLGRLHRQPADLHRRLSRRTTCRSRSWSKARPASARPSWRSRSPPCLDLPLIRMQCYEGLDESKALYEWKYGKQLLYTQILKDKIGDVLGDDRRPGRRAEQAARLRRHLLLGAVPGAAAAAARAAAAGRRGAADRRDRQVRPGVRGVPAGDPVRLPGDHPRDRHRPCGGTRRSCC